MNDLSNANVPLLILTGALLVGIPGAKILSWSSILRWTWARLRQRMGSPVSGSVDEVIRRRVNDEASPAATSIGPDSIQKSVERLRQDVDSLSTLVRSDADETWDCLSQRLGDMGFNLTRFNEEEFALLVDGGEKYYRSEHWEVCYEAQRIGYGRLDGEKNPPLEMSLLISALKTWLNIDEWLEKRCEKGSSCLTLGSHPSLRDLHFTQLPVDRISIELSGLKQISANTIVHYLVASKKVSHISLFGTSQLAVPQLYQIMNKCRSLNCMTICSLPVTRQEIENLAYAFPHVRIELLTII